MKNLLAAIFIIVVSMLITNPSEDDHRDAVKAKLSKTIGVDGLLAKGFLNAIVSKEVYTEDYILFSTCNVRGQLVGIGILGTVIFKGTLTKQFYLYD
tara:strand:- start:530 stop:820 length:291 start_codon:yes stop_codon:yes gene_type:complete